MKKLTIAPLAAMGCLVMVLAGCGSSSDGNDGSTKNASASGCKALDSLRKDGVKVGMNGSAPYAYFEAKQPKGYELDINKDVMSKLGVSKIDVQLINFDSLIPSLQAKRIDMIASGMWITPPRQEQVQFSDPISRFGSVIITSKGNPENITAWQDIKGKTVGMDEGQGDQQPAEDIGAKVKTYRNGLPEIVADLKAGRIDAIVYDELYTKLQIIKNPDLGIEISGPTPDMNNDGFAFRKDDGCLVDAYNKQLQTMFADGTILKIYKEYGLDEAELPKSS